MGLAVLSRVWRCRRAVQKFERGRARLASRLALARSSHSLGWRPILLWPIGAFDRPLASNSIRFAFELSIAAKAGTAVTSHLCVFVLVAHNGFVSASYVVAGLPALALLC